MKVCRGLAAATAATAIGLVGGIAQASEDERILSVTANYATFSADERNPHGAGLAAGFEYGLSDALWLRAAGGGAAYSDSGDFAWSSHATFGITYVLDVLQYVPYVNIGAGVFVTDSARDDVDLTVDPVAELGLGLDVLSSRRFSYGAYLRVSALTDTTIFRAGLRMSWRSGFF